MATERHYRRSLAEIDLRRIKDNFIRFRDAKAPGAFICPMVKANAYGHGATHVAKALRSAGAKYLGVALVEEGEELRRAGDRDPILVFGPVDREAAETVVRESLTVVVSEWDHLDVIEQARNQLGETRVSVHAEFNTGMNRLGFEVNEAAKVREWFKANSNMKLEGICTHLLRGDDAGADEGESATQLRRFYEVSQAFSDMPALIRHGLNSSAVINLVGQTQASDPKFFEFVTSLGARPGIGLYGYGGKNDEGHTLGLKPVMSLRTHIISLHRVAKDARVSYGPTWKAPRESLIGVLPFGYADGYRRGLTNKSSVLYNGHRVPQVGTVCMDYFMIDLTDVESKLKVPAKVGDEVFLMGEQGTERITADNLAEWAGTISYEILTGIGKRVPRVFLG